MNRVAIFAALVAGAVAPAASALSPASPEQMLCASSYIFVGRALDARPDPAGQKDISPPYYRQEPVHLAIEVREILGVAHPPARRAPVIALNAGDTIQGWTQAIVIPGSVRQGKYRYQGGLQFDAPIESALPHEVIEAAYTGEDFIFSAAMTGIQPRYGVLVWPASRRSWVLETMASVARSRMTTAYSEECPSVVTAR